MPTPWLPTTLFIAVALSPGLSYSSPSDKGLQNRSEEQDPLIYGGQQTNSCQFPTTTLMDRAGGYCSGVLVHPEIILYAAHCETVSNAVFGENTRDRISVPVSECRHNPDFVEGPFGNAITEDYAYCKLARPVTEFPITPVIFGCEVDQYVQPGADAWIAGFGRTESGGNGDTKYWAKTTIDNLEMGMVHVGGGGTASQKGDSGGPAYTRLEDGSWRVIGTVSSGIENPPAFFPSAYVPAHTVVPWVEEQSGIDITPCHDSDGTWNPSSECEGFATDPLLEAPGASGSWANSCSGADDGSEPSQTCGPPHTATNDNAGPEVTILNPKDGDFFETIPTTLDIEVEVKDEWISFVRLYVDGIAKGEREEAPFVFDGLSFDEGRYELIAKAEDYWGNQGESLPVTFGVGIEPDASTTDDPEDSGLPPDEDSGSPTGSDGSAGDTSEPDDSGTSGSASGTDGDGSGENGMDNNSSESGSTSDSAGQFETTGDSVDGCSCKSSQKAPSPLLFTLSMFVFFRLRRRCI